MKHARKLASLLLALVMVLALATTAFAATNDGQITIGNPVEGETYNAYLMFELESYVTGGAYSYKITDEWEEFVSTGYGKNIFQVSNGYVTLKDDVSIDNDSTEAAALAKAALAYAKEKKLTPAATLPENGSYVASGLTLGYYVVDSSLGALCGLNTTDKEIIINEKNETPTIDKTVKGGSTTTLGENNTAKVGDTVEFQIIVHAKKGAQNYMLHDRLSTGLTLDATSIAVTGLTVNTDYTVATTTTDGCSFEITFKDTYLNSITANTDITVTYSATVNANAVVEDAGKNKTKLSYGDESKTEWDETNTVTRKFDIVKTDSSNNLLAGAKFELYDAQTAGKEIKLVKVTSGTGAPYYRPALEGETVAVIETNAASKVTVKGLAGKTYWLEETEAPDGYNKLAGRVEVDLTSGDLNTSMTGTTWNEDNGGVHIENKSGTELPSTGGIGTTIFYVLGSILVIGAAVLLVTKKRMSAKN